MPKLKDIGLLTRPKLKLVRGTRLTSALFIGVSALVAAGILWAANMYYDIDAGKIVVEEVQRMLKKVEINAPAGTTALEISQGNIVFSTGGAIEQTGTGQVTFAGNVDANAGLDVTNAALTVGGTNFQVATSGVITWGGDTNLYRASANVLRTDDDFIMGANATTTGNLSVGGNVTIDGDLQFLGNQTISGTGTLTINPTGNLYLQSTSYYVDENGFLIIAKVISPELEYSGNIIIDANSATNTTVTVTNQDGTYLADLVVEGDINVQGGRITLASGETIDAETADQVTINADGLTIVKSGGSEILRVDSSGLKVTGVATTTNTLYVTGGGAQITGNVQISSGNLTVEGNILPSADATYNLGSSSARWANFYSATTTVGTASGDRIITNANTIQATGPLTVQFDEAGGFILQRDVAGDTILVVEPSGKVTLYSRGGQDLVLDADSGAVRIASGDTLYVDNIAIAGEGKIIGIIPIFGFDLPAQTASTSYVKVSRTLQNYPFPATTTGTTRVHKFVIRYTDALPLASTTDWRVSTTTGAAYSTFTLPGCNNSNLDQGRAQITGNVDIPTDGTAWWLEVSSQPPYPENPIRIFQIFLVAFDVKQ